MTLTRNATKMLPAVIIIVCSVICELSATPTFSFSLKGSADVGLNSEQLVEKYGYPFETHYIFTEDDYILAAHRIPHGVDSGRNISGKRPPVLISHGLTSSSADFVNMGPDRSMGFILADAGYDVWIVNARGNTWSRNHSFLDPDKDKRKFWDFSWHEIGKYDLPAAIDYILKHTDEEKLQYIGHSQGCTAFFVMASERPEYNKKIRLASLMAPNSVMKYASWQMKLASLGIKQTEMLLKLFGIYELPLTRLEHLIDGMVCDMPWNRFLCAMLMFSIAGYPDFPELDMERLAVIATNAPAGASMKQFIHYGQQVKSGGFNQYDYGLLENIKRYGSTKPRPYNFAKMTAPIAIYYGKNDQLVSVKDVDLVNSMLPNVVESYLVPYNLFNHVDFIFAKDVVNLVYNRLMEVMEKH